MLDNSPQFLATAFLPLLKNMSLLIIRAAQGIHRPTEKWGGESTVKTLLKKAEENSEDPYLALLAYCNTPLACEYSPAELMMCRTLRSTLPTTMEQLKPKLPDMAVFQEREKKMKL